MPGFVCVFCVRWIGSNVVIASRLQVHFGVASEPNRYLLAIKVARIVKQTSSLLKICLASGAELSRVLAKPSYFCGRATRAAHEASAKAWRNLASSSLSTEASTVTDIFVTRHSDVDLAIDYIALSWRGLPLLGKHASLLNNPRVALALIVSRGKQAFNYIDESLKKNKCFVLQAVTVRWKVLAEVDETFKNDYDIVLAAVKQHGYAIWLASEEMQRNTTIVLAAQHYHCASGATLPLCKRRNTCTYRQGPYDD